jgi:hypothetical protein
MGVRTNMGYKLTIGFYLVSDGSSLWASHAALADASSVGQVARGLAEICRLFARLNPNETGFRIPEVNDSLHHFVEGLFLAVRSAFGDGWLRSVAIKRPGRGPRHVTHVVRSSAAGRGPRTREKRPRWDIGLAWPRRLETLPKKSRARIAIVNDALDHSRRVSVLHHLLTVN